MFKSFHTRPLLIVLFLTVLSASADPAAEAYRDARALLSADRKAEAAARFEAATATTNANAAAAAWFGRGEALYGLQQWAATVTAYDTLLKRYPTSPLAPQALFARGHAEHQAGRLAQAVNTFTAFQKQYPANALAPSCTALIGRISKTLEIRARQQATEKLTRELAAINAAVRTEKFDEARSIIERFMQTHPEHPQTADLRFLLATCAYRTKDYNRAAELYRLFLNKHPQHARAAVARTQLADSLMRSGLYEEARVLYAQWADETQDPQEEARATLSIGDCYAAQQKWDDAERAFLSVEVLRGSDALRPIALNRLASLYDKMGQSDKARRTREDLRRRYPE